MKLPQHIHIPKIPKLFQDMKITLNTVALFICLQGIFFLKTWK